MATWITLPSVSLTNGSNTVSVTGSIDLSAIKAGWALIISSNYVEIASGTSSDSSGNSMLTLALPWDGSAVINQPAKIQPTGAPFLEGIAALEATNEYAIDVHNTLTEIATEDKDVTITDPTGTEHTFASMLKNTRLVKELIDNGNSELSAIVQDVKSKLEQTAMSKAEFFALAEERKRNYAGSGFVEWGKSWVSTNDKVNEGIWTRPNVYTNFIVMGTGGDTPYGKSLTEYPVALVGGVIHEIQSVDFGSTTKNRIKFPDAEKGTRSYDSDSEIVVDFLTDIDPKYGDIAGTVDEAISRNFEGLVRDGDFRLGGAGWNSRGGASVTYEKNLASIKDLEGDAASGIYRDITYEPGTYELCAIMRAGEGGGSSALIINSISGENTPTVNVTQNDTREWSTVKYSFTLTEITILRVNLRAVGTNAGDEVEFKSVSSRKKSNQPILARQDYCFLETWHEKVSDKDIFCPLGNVQCGLGSSLVEGVDLSPLTDFGVDQGYSAYGLWDTETEGRGVKWSTLNLEDQRACLDHPANNLYYDKASGELIQVRYRIRVVEGLGSNWNGVSPQEYFVLTYGTLSYSAVKPQGMLSSIPADLAGRTESGHTNGFFACASSGQYPTNAYEGDTNLFMATNGSATAGVLPSYFGIEGLCSALPICLIQRGNQGAYHPEYNPTGYSPTVTDDGASSAFWYEQSWVKSPLDCFQGNGNASFPWGDGGSGISGRLDNYSYHDGLYAEQTQDLRLSAKKQDIAALTELGIRDAVKGTKRGAEKVPFTHWVTKEYQATGADSYVSRKWLTNSSNHLFYYLDTTELDISIGDRFRIIDPEYGIDVAGEVSILSDDFIRIYEYTNYGSYTVVANRNGGVDNSNDVYLAKESLLDVEFNTLPYVDIIGDPNRIMETFPNGVVGHWVPVLPLGVTGQLMPISRKVTSVESTKWVFSDNAGESWSSSSATFVDSKSNVFTGQFGEDRVGLFYYSTPSSFTKPSIYRPVYRTLGKVYLTSFHSTSYGASLNYSLTGKVATSTSGGQDRYIDLVSWQLLSSGELYEQAGLFVTSQEITLGNAPTNDSPGVKALYYIVEVDGLLYLQYQGRGMIHSGTDWGDDYTIPLEHKESTMVDDNGNTVKTFTHTEIFPIGIADYTQTN